MEFKWAMDWHKTWLGNALDGKIIQFMGEFLLPCLIGKRADVPNSSSDKRITGKSWMLIIHCNIGSHPVQYLPRNHTCNHILMCTLQSGPTNAWKISIFDTSIDEYAIFNSCYMLSICCYVSLLEGKCNRICSIYGPGPGYTRWLVSNHLGAGLGMDQDWYAPTSFGRSKFTIPSGND